MSQSSRVNDFISKLNTLDRPKPQLFDEAALTEANQTFLDKLSVLKLLKIKEANHASFDVQEIKPHLSPHQPNYGLQTPPDSGLKSPIRQHGNRREIRQRTPKRQESKQLFVSPYRPPRLPHEAFYLQQITNVPEERLLMIAKQDPNLKVKEWLKKNSKYISTSREERNIRSPRPKKVKCVNKSVFQRKEYSEKEMSSSCLSSQEDSDYYDGNSFEEGDLTEKA